MQTAYVQKESEQDESELDFFMGHPFPIISMLLQKNVSLTEVSIISGMRGFYTLTTEHVTITNSLVTLKPSYPIKTISIANSYVIIKYEPSKSNLPNKVTIKFDPKSNFLLESNSGFDLTINFNGTDYKIVTNLERFGKETLDNLISWLNILEMQNYDLAILNKYESAKKDLIITFALNYAQDMPHETRINLENFVKKISLVDDKVDDKMNDYSTSDDDTEMIGLADADAGEL